MGDGTSKSDPACSDSRLVTAHRPATGQDQRPSRRCLAQGQNGYGRCRLPHPKDHSESRFPRYRFGESRFSRTSGCQRRNQIGPVRRSKTGPLGMMLMPLAVLRVVPVGHRRDPRALRSSIRPKTSGAPCVRTGSPIGSSGVTTISSITAATPGSSSPTSPGPSCPLGCATGPRWVNLNGRSPYSPKPGSLLRSNGSLSRCEINSSGSNGRFSKSTGGFDKAIVSGRALEMPV